MILLVSYDLNGKERPSAYEDVAKMIKTHATSWRKPLYSQWFVETHDSVATWCERMKGVTDKGDYWFVNQVTHPNDGWMPESFWEWFKPRE